MSEPAESSGSAGRTVEFIADFLRRHRDEPMFVYYPMALPHWPMVTTPRSEVWSDPERRLEEDVRYFPDMVAYMDELVGRLVGHIDDLGLGENTLILFYSDNGTDRRIVSGFRGRDIPGGKGLTTQNGIRVPIYSVRGIVGECPRRRARRAAHRPVSRPAQRLLISGPPEERCLHTSERGAFPHIWK